MSEEENGELGKRSRGRPVTGRTPAFKFRLPPDLKENIEWDLPESKDKNITAWIIKAIRMRLGQTKQQ